MGPHRKKLYALAASSGSEPAYEDIVPQDGQTIEVWCRAGQRQAVQDLEAEHRHARRRVL